MKIAFGSDESCDIHKIMLEDLKARGLEVKLFGALKTLKEASWVETGIQVAKAVQNGECDEGIILCWTGTGITIAANKTQGIRAALCVDAETAKSARIWNHANILALSNRLLSPGLAKEILNAWFSTTMDQRGAEEVATLSKIENE